MGQLDLPEELQAMRGVGRFRQPGVRAEAQSIQTAKHEAGAVSALTCRPETKSSGAGTARAAERGVDGSPAQSWIREADTPGSGCRLSKAVWETLGRKTLEPNCAAPRPETGKTVGTGLGHGTALVPGV